MNLDLVKQMISFTHDLCFVLKDDEIVQKTNSFLEKKKKISFEGLISKNVLFLTSVKG